MAIYQFEISYQSYKVQYQLMKHQNDNDQFFSEKKKFRDKAIILIGFSGGFRRSELVNIDYDDLEFVNEGVKIFIKRSKTDQSGEGMIKAIPYFDNKIFCPVVKLKDWINFSEIRSGKVFDISDKSVALIIKKYALLSGLDPNKYGGHSLRSGFATSAAAASSMSHTSTRSQAGRSTRTTASSGACAMPAPKTSSTSPFPSSPR